MRLRIRIVIVFALASAACAQDGTGVVNGPANPVAPALPTRPRDTPIPFVHAEGTSVWAAFVEPGAQDRHVTVGRCEEWVIAPEGRALVRDAEGELAGERGDLLVVQGYGATPSHGFDLALTAPALLLRLGGDSPCDRPSFRRGKIAGGVAPELTWAKGAMHAHLDLESSRLYLGRLEGTAPVAEHEHAGSTEVICTFEASGTFVRAGVEHHLGPHQVVFVPPGTKHAWRPDPGSRLVAIQLYDPPGPEQRFKQLAAAEAAAPR